jgi:vacuolar iron transporter family protein
MKSIDNTLDIHFIHRSNWLRAAVLGANDGIISIASLAIGIATASSTREPVILATVAGLAAGALSMAAGEYVLYLLARKQMLRNQTLKESKKNWTKFLK